MIEKTNSRAGNVVDSPKEKDVLFVDFRIRSNDSIFEEKKEWMINHHKNNIRRKAEIDIPDDQFSIETQIRDGFKYFRLKYEKQ